MHPVSSRLPLAVLYHPVRVGSELCGARVLRSTCPAFKLSRAVLVSLSCGRPGLLAEIPGRFSSSSSLPPSFAKGRRTTVFLPRGAAQRGAPSRSLRGAP